MTLFDPHDLPAHPRPAKQTGLPAGIDHRPGYLDLAAQRALLAALGPLVADAPVYRACMPRSGKPLSVGMTNLGPLGWYADREGYRYVRRHPETGRRWPAIPGILLDLWTELTHYPALPECCLVNFYDANARMGLHQDRDERDLAAPVLSISLGDTALFRVGGTTRRGPTRSFHLASGDALVIGGPARLAFHGVDRIIPGSSGLIEGGGRINLTLRRVGQSGPA